jgi:hypothetical protein
MARWYAGMKKDRSFESFESNELPIEETHGHLYVLVCGPFHTKRGCDLFCETNSKLFVVTQDMAETAAEELVR